MSNQKYTDEVSENEIKVRHPKPPTKKDLKMLEFMDNGGILNNDNGDKIFHCRGVRDAIYRLNCAGYDIKHQDATRTYADGTTAQFRNWYTKSPEILSANCKTEKALKADGSISQISRNIQKLTGNATVVMPELFPNYQNS